MTAIMDLMDTINAFVWGPPMMIILVGTGVFLTIRLGFPQFKHTSYALKLIFKGALKKTHPKKKKEKLLLSKPLLQPLPQQ